MYICLDKHVQRKEFQIGMEKAENMYLEYNIKCVYLGFFFIYFWGNFDHSPTDGACFFGKVFSTFEKHIHQT